jgi:hypothetical protein
VHVPLAIRYPAQQTPRRAVLGRFLFLFVFLLAAMFAIEMLQPMQRHVVLPWTSLLADASGWLMRLFDDQVAVSGKIISSTVKPFSVSIEPGCNGVQGLNLVRIISLFYLGLWDRESFEWAHLYVWQALIILDALVVFLVWARFLPPEPRSGVVDA